MPVAKATKSARPTRKSSSRPKAAAKAKPKPAAPAGGSRAVDQHLRDVGGWRAATLAQVRALIVAAVPGVEEDVKWRKASNGMLGVATWSRDGLLCTGESYKDKVKFTFARGASLPDPEGLFTADDKGATRRAIDLREGETVDATAFKELAAAAAAFNEED